MGGSSDSISDPDPTPMVASEANDELQSKRRETQKKAVSTYGRQTTVLASSANSNKKTILGG